MVPSAGVALLCISLRTLTAGRLTILGAMLFAAEARQSCGAIGRPKI